MTKYFTKYVLPYCTQFLCRRQQDVVTFFLFFSMTIMYAMRTSLPMALIEINGGHLVEHHKFPKTYCPGAYNHVSTGPKADWTEFEVGLIFSVYYIGYGIGHIPGCIVSLKYGAKIVLLFCVFGSSTLNMVLPMVINFTNYSMILLIQFVIGLVQGTKFPAVADMLVCWIPEADFPFCVRFVLAGLPAGTLLGFLGTGISISMSNKWTVVFYVFGVTGYIFCGLFYLFCFERPEKNPFIGNAEKDFLSQNIMVSGTEISAKRLSEIPWRRILKSTSIISLIPAQFGHDYVFFAFVTYLPKYAADILHLDLFQLTVYATVVNIFRNLVVVITILSFKYMQCTGNRYDTLRKTIFSISSFVPSIFFVLATFSECNQAATIICFGIGISLSGFCHPEIRGNVFDINKPYAGCILAALNCFTGAVAAITFLFIGVVVETRSPTEWKLISLVSFMVLNTSSTLYIIWSSAKPDSFQSMDMQKIQNAVFQHSLEREENEM